MSNLLLNLTIIVTKISLVSHKKLGKTLVRYLMCAVSGRFPARCLLGHHPHQHSPPPSEEVPGTHDVWVWRRSAARSDPDIWNCTLDNQHHLPYCLHWKHRLLKCYPLWCHISKLNFYPKYLLTKLSYSRPLHPAWLHGSGGLLSQPLFWWQAFWSRLLLWWDNLSFYLTPKLTF